MDKVQENVCFYKDEALICKSPLAQTRDASLHRRYKCKYTSKWMGVSEKWRNSVFGALWGNSKYYDNESLLYLHICRGQESGVKWQKCTHYTHIHTHNHDGDEILN